jgi:autotransporter passenger strand-loop-strand repeat protein
MSGATIGDIVGLVEIDHAAITLFDQAGLNDVFVTLTNLNGSAVLDSNGDIVAPVETTAAGIVNGEFAFNNIAFGTYALELSPNATLASSIIGRDIFTLNAATEAAINSGNFTEYPIIDVAASFSQPTNTLGVINGFVYTDANKDGIRDNGEKAGAGQEMALLNAGGTVVDVTTASATGMFSFTDLTPGDYTISDLSDVISQAPVGGTIAITTANETISGVTIGAYANSITGFAFADSNGDGVRNANETVFAGQTVELLNGSGTVVAAANTNGKGDFSFNGVNPGTYTFSIAGGGVDGGNHGGTITIGESSINNVTIGAYDYASVSGFLFLDENDDGTFEVTPQGIDPDDPLGTTDPATIEFINSKGSVAAVATSNQLAEFGVTLSPGVYTLGDAQLNSGFSGIVSGGSAFTTITVTSGEILSGESVGVYVPNSILVPSIFLDTNFDGNDDGSIDNFTASSALPVTVALLNQDGGIAKNLAGVSQVITITSGVLQGVSGNGVVEVPAASFNDLAPGYYSVEVSAPGYQSEQSVYPIGAALETAGIPEEPQTAVQSVALYKIGSGVTISGTVFAPNAGGTHQGLANDTVTLIENVNGSPEAAQTVETNAQGQYSFSGLGTAANGTYEIDFGIPVGYAATTSVHNVAVNGTGTAGAVSGPSAGFTLSTAAPATLAASTTLNIVLIGQSNAGFFTQNGYLNSLQQDIEKYLGFNGTNQIVNVITGVGGPNSGSNNISSAPGTQFGGTALTTDWLNPDNGNEAAGFTAGANQDGQYSLMNAVLTYLAQTVASDPSLAMQPTVILDLHNESDAENPFLNTSIWLDALNLEASSIRAVLGQNAANVPYAFVNAIPFPEEPFAPASQAQVDENEQAIRLGMESLSSTPAFNGFIAAQINDVDQNYQALGDGAWHLTSGSTVVNGVTLGAEYNPQNNDLYDDYVLEQRLALSLADEFSASALAGSPVAAQVANTGSLYDDTGPLVTGAATVAGSPGELLLTVKQFDAATGFNTSLSTDAQNGVGWSIRTSATGANSRLVATATSATIINATEVLLTFNTAVPASSSGDELFYGWGGERIAPAATLNTTTDGYNGTTYNGENAAIYDSNGEPIYTNAAGVLIGSTQERVTGHLTVALGQTVTNPVIAGGTLALATGSSISGDISFSGTGGVLLLDEAPPVNAIDGFAAHDTIILSGFSASNAAGLTGGGLTLISGATSETLHLTGTPAADLVITQGSAGTTIATSIKGVPTTLAAGGFEIVTSGGAASKTVVTSGGTQKVYAHGNVVSTTVEAGGVLLVSSGGLETSGTIAGGTLDIAGGGRASGPFDFTGTGGTLVIEGAAIPADVISGFAAGDTIKLSAVPYKVADTVKVATAGIVTVTAGSTNYAVHVAGATVGETDFHFGPGSLLTRSTAAAKTMAFVRPPAQLAQMAEVAQQPAHAVAVHRETSIIISAKAMPLVTHSAGQAAYPMTDVLHAARGGVQMTIALGHLWSA